MKTYSVRIEKELDDEIRREARRDGRSESSVIRQALRSFFSSKPGTSKKAPGRQGGPGKSVLQNQRKESE